MAWALNQTPLTGADTVWTFLQVAINPQKYQPNVFPIQAFGGPSACGCPSFPPEFPWATPRPFTGPFPPLGPVPPIDFDDCEKWWGFGRFPLEPNDWAGKGPCCPAGYSVTTSGFTGGGYTLCGLLQKSSADLMVDGSWFVLQTPPYLTSPRPPDGTVYHRQFSWQRGPDNTQWRIKYSARAGFTGGTPGPNQTPSALDERILLGGGTDASPTYGTLLPPDGSYRAQINVYQDGLIPGCYMVTYPIGNPTANSAFVIDALACGSYPVDGIGLPQEQDPIVIYLYQGTGTLQAMTLASEVNGPVGWLNYGVVSPPPTQAFVRLPGSFDGVYDSSGTPQVVIPRGLNQGIINDRVDTARATYSRRAALGGTTGRKGDASGWEWNGIVGLGNGQLIGQAGARGHFPFFWLTLGDVLLRWDGVTPTVLL
jgi:hypothetical protein